MTTAAELIRELAYGTERKGDGTASSATDSTIVDPVGLVAFDAQSVNNLWLLIVKGSGAGQIQRVTGFIEATGTITVSPDFDTRPDSTSEYILLSKDPRLYLQVLRRASSRIREFRPYFYAKPLPRQFELGGNLLRNGLFRLYSGTTMPSWTLTGTGNDDGSYIEAEASPTQWGLRFTDAVTLTQTIQARDLSPFYESGERLTLYLLAHVATENSDLSVQVAGDDAVELAVGWNWTEVDHTITDDDISDGITVTIKAATAAIDGHLACVWVPYPTRYRSQGMIRLPEDAALHAFSGDMWLTERIRTERTYPLRDRNPVRFGSYKAIRVEDGINVRFNPPLELHGRVLRWEAVTRSGTITGMTSDWEGSDEAILLLAKAQMLLDEARTFEEQGEARRQVRSALESVREIAPRYRGPTMELQAY